MSYISLQDAKEYLRADTDDDDELITGFISKAQRFIEDETGRIFESDGSTALKRLDACRDTDRALLLLPRDCFGITAVVNGDGTTITSDQYVTEPRDGGDGRIAGIAPFWGIRLLASSGKSWTYTTDPENAISITAQWAYSSSPPSTVAQAVLELTAYLYRRRDTSIEIDRPIETAGITILPSSIPKTIKDVIALYRRRNIKAIG